MDIFNGSLKLAADRLNQSVRDKAYHDDPVMWAEDKLGVVLWSKQKEILRSIVHNKRTAVKSSHSVGKTFLSAIASCWWISTRENCMVQSTAPTYAQVHSLLWEEIRKMHLKADLVGHVTLKDQWSRPSFNASTGRTGINLVGEGKKPADSNIHGFHGTHRPDGVFAVLDEGGGIARSIFTGAEAITTANMDRILVVGNPDDPNTEFGDIYLSPTGEWNLITVSAYDTPHFTGEAEELRERYKDDPEKLASVEALLAGMPNPEWIESRRKDWGEDSPRFMSKVLAQFPTVSVDSLFTPTEVDIGLNTVIDPTGTFRVIGVDVARYGADKTVVCANFGGHIEFLASYASSDTMEVAAQVHKLAIEHEIDQVRVDGIGVGGGVVDRLVSLARTAPVPYVVVEMTASASPPDKTLHSNARAYWHDSVKTQLRAGLLDLPIDKTKEFPDGTIKEATLFAKEFNKELTNIRYEFRSGIMKIESKDDMRRRKVHSPDFSDAFVMAAAPINYVADDPLNSARPGDILEIDVMEDLEMVSLY